MDLRSIDSKDNVGRLNDFRLFEEVVDIVCKLYRIILFMYRA